MNMASPSTSYQAVWRACMKEAAAQGRSLMQRLVVRAGESMPRRGASFPSDAERKLFAEAARTLIKHETALCDAYPQALLAEFAQAISGDTRKSVGLSFDALELMGEEQMQESVEVLRLQQAVMHEVEGDLTDLNALVCAAQGLNTVQVERNPLRPEVYVRALRTVLQQSPVPALMRRRWLQHLGEALGPELARVYQELCALLRLHGVSEARFHATVSAELPQPTSAAALGAASQANASSLLNLVELKRLLAGDFEDSVAVNANVRPDFSATMPAAFEALEEMKQVEQVMKRLKQRQEGAAPAAAGSTPHGGARALAQEVVSLMVENIASDPRLLAPIQQCVRDLLPALMRLALDDPRFFSDRRHPARRLLEQMTQRSLAWDSAAAPAFLAFVEPLQQAVEVLLSTHIAGAEPFDFALKTLEEAWGDAQQRDRRFREKAVRTLLHAEQRNLLAENVAREMRARADLVTAPREIAAFVTGPWSQVMAQARLSDTAGAPDPGHYTALVDDLVWSTQPKVAAADTARLLKLAAPMTEKLKHGLATIDYPPSAMQRLLDYMAALHRQAIQAATEPGRPVALSTSMSREELEAMLGGDDDDGRGTWLGSTEAQHSGFVHTNHSITPKALFQETEPASLGETQPLADPVTPVLPEGALAPGAWVEMMMPDGWGRYQVTWASPHGTLFMFAGAAGKSHSMTHRLLGKMLQGGTLRMISSQAVVDGALDAVAQTALRNSLDIKV